MSELDTEDLRDTPPDWYRYAICTKGSHDKFYEVRVDLLANGLWQLTVRYGRRPDLGAGSIKPETHPTMEIAIASANARIDNKIATRDYVTMDRPVDANSQVRMDARPF